MDVKGLAVLDDRVTGIVSALRSAAQLDVFAQHVGDLALPFITPFSMVSGLFGAARAIGIGRTLGACRLSAVSHGPADSTRDSPNTIVAITLQPEALQYLYVRSRHCKRKGVHVTAQTFVVLNAPRRAGGGETGVATSLQTALSLDQASDIDGALHCHKTIVLLL